MAESDAYSSGMSRPSFFEMAAADRLVQGLKPALDHILITISRHVPRFAGLADWGDELFYPMCFLLDRHYLNAHSATFAENFYCLKRVQLVEAPPPSPPVSLSGTIVPSLPATNVTRILSPSEKLRTAIFMTGVPYLRCKLEKYY